MSERAVPTFSLRALGSALSPPPRFSPPAAEGGFLTAYARMCLPRRRVCAALAAVIWGAFVCVDFAAGGPTLGITLALRASVVIAIACALALSFHPAFLDERFAERVMAGLAILLYLPFLGIVAEIVPDSDPILDGAGFIVYVAFVAGFTWLRAAPMLLVLTVCVAGAAAVVALDMAGLAALAPPPRPPLAAVLVSRGYPMLMAYMAIVAFVSYASAVQREREARTAYQREQALEESRAQVERGARALVAAESELRRLAERRDRDKSKFLADAAHDLSQPAHAVSLLIDSARMALERGERARARTLVASAAGAAEAARAAFRAVLEISQLESGLVRPSLAVTDMAALAEEVAGPFRALAEARGVSLVLRRPRVPAFAVTDPALFGRALGNLISNAIKYADPARGPARRALVAVSAAGGRVRVAVADNGVGMPPERIGEAFKPFVQLANPERDRDNGLGLGLSIVEATMDLLEGHDVQARSAPGCGTRVTLAAPRRRPAAAPAPASLAEPAAALADLFVWCVEDDPLAREGLKAWLEAQGVLGRFSAGVADLETALERAERAPDLVICDYRLGPDHTANDVAGLFARRWPEGTPMLVVTGEAAALPLAGAFAEVLRKPLAPEVLAAAIRRTARRLRSRAAE